MKKKSAGNSSAILRESLPGEYASKIGDIRDRYETIVMELLAARYMQTDGKRYSLGTVLRGKCETDKALKGFLQHLGKWIKAFALRYLHLRVAA